jgi:hypothetical protein
MAKGLAEQCKQFLRDELPPEVRLSLRLILFPVFFPVFRAALSSSPGFRRSDEASS